MIGERREALAALHRYGNHEIRSMGGFLLIYMKMTEMQHLLGAVDRRPS